MISNKSASIKKGKDTSVEDVMKKQGTMRLEHGADGLFHLDEFNFPHAVALHDSALKAEPLIATYRKLYAMIDLEHHPGKSKNL